MTWRPQHLFEIYTFADKYDTRELRMAAMETIQMKYIQKSPRKYLLPPITAVSWASLRLPSTPPLFRLLADAWSTRLTFGRHSGSSSYEQAEYCLRTPKEFLAECFVALKRHNAALACKKCQPDGSEEVCEAITHGANDAVVFNDKHLCTYHEHGGDDEEKARCCLRWESFAYKLGYGK